MRSPVVLTDHPPHPVRPNAAPSPQQHPSHEYPSHQAAGPGRVTRRVRLVAVVGAAIALFAACGPDTGAAPASPGSPEAIIREVFNPLGEGDKAVRVAACESGLNPAAISRGGTYQGLFQLGSHVVAIHAYGGNRLDARQNALAARDLRVQRGNWSAWPVCGGR